MSTRRPPVPKIVVEVSVDELRAAQRLLRTAGASNRVSEIVSAHCAVLDTLTRMLGRPRRLPATGGGE